MRGVVRPHADPAPLGFAERLRVERGVPVHVHAADASRARGEEKAHASFGSWRPGATARFFAYAATHGGFRTRYVREVREVADGDVLDLPGSPRIVGLPGHSPGSEAVHFPALDAVMVGDALTTRDVLTGRTGPQPAPFTDDEAQALRSLDRLAELDARWVLPGHGAPSDAGTAEVVRLVRDAARAHPR